MRQVGVVAPGPARCEAQQVEHDDRLVKVDGEERLHVGTGGVHGHGADCALADLVSRLRSGHPGDMTGWVFSIVDRLGAVGVGLLILLENLIPPIPSEVILPLAGFRARTGTLDLVAVWPAATAGSLLGALLLYGLGAWLGYDRLYQLAGRRWFVLASRKDLERGRTVFDNHGGKVVLLARFVPFLRSIVSIPAGATRMPLLRFTVLTAIGSGIWNAAFLGLGWLLGDNWDQIQGWLGPVSYVVVGLVVVGLVVLMVRRRRAHRTELRV